MLITEIAAAPSLPSSFVSLHLSPCMLITEIAAATSLPSSFVSLHADFQNFPLHLSSFICLPACWFPKSPPVSLHADSQNHSLFSCLQNLPSSFVFLHLSPCMLIPKITASSFVSLPLSPCMLIPKITASSVVSLHLSPCMLITEIAAAPSLPSSFVSLHADSQSPCMLITEIAAAPSLPSSFVKSLGTNVVSPHWSCFLMASRWADAPSLALRYSAAGGTADLSADVGLILDPSAGPNSGAPAATDLQPLMHCGNLGMASTKFCRRRGEGSRRAMASGEGEMIHITSPSLPPKVHGLGKAVSFGTSPPQQAVKRSLLRAKRRAQREGWTFYKGQLLTLIALGGLDAPPHAPRQAHRPGLALLPPRCSRRASMISWNAGGLTTEVYQELLLWLNSQCVDIALIQGTRWKGERIWRARGYSFIQLGASEDSKNVHCGLLVCISDQFCKYDDIAFAIQHPGRLMHVKCKLGHNSLDIVNFYQFPTSYTQTRINPLEARGHLWSQLDTLMHSLPHRNITVLAGDFNCALHSSPKQTLPDDFLELQELIKKYHFGSVRGHDHSPTFFGNQGNSSIDHILLPQAQMDEHSRHGHSLPAFPVAGWRATRDHVPVIASLPLHWRCWYRRPPQTQRFPRSAYEVLHDAWRTHNPLWPELQAKLDIVITCIPQDVQHLPRLVRETIGTCALSMKHHPRSIPISQAPSRSVVAQIWHSYAIVRRTQSFSTAALFRAWMHSARMLILKRRLSQSCRMAKAQRLHLAIADARAAADRHDTRTIFAIIRRLTPKQPYRAIRLRGSQGEALLASEECDLFTQHFESVFKVAKPTFPSAVGPLAEMPFSEHDLAKALAHAPVGKAVGPSSLPNLVLRMLSEPLAAWLWKALFRAWCCDTSPSIPQVWRDAWLVLLAKRSVRTPSDVRPIALTDSIGKTILGLFTQALKPQVMPKLMHLPIFAFIPGRGTLESWGFAFCLWPLSCCQRCL